MRLPFMKQVKPKTESYRLGGNYDMAIPPGWGYNQYLASYGQVGWLFGAVSVIANSVAEVGWHLYQTKGKERVELENHPALDLLNKVNPFQTRYEFFQLLVTYRQLVGDSYIILNYARNGYPVEMWLASPSYMKIISHPTQYISHYEFERGENKTRFELNEVIRIKDPNPLNPLAGLGSVQPIASDLDSERHAASYQNKLFYNDARPGLIVSVKDSDPGPEAKDEIVKYWNQQYRGVSKAYKVAFLFGDATPHMVTLSNKDMDFKELRKYSRDTILGTKHIPLSVMGITENVNRANAEAGEYTFSKRVIKPELTQIKEALNEQLCPLFGEGLEFDFDDPVPANREQMVDETSRLVTAGVITREMACQKLGYNIPTEGTYLLPFSVSPTPVTEVSSNPKAIKSYSDMQKEAIWRSYVGQAEKDEAQFKSVINRLFDKQSQEVKENIGRDYYFNLTQADDDFNTGLLPAVEQSFKTGWGFADSATRHPIKGIDPILNPLALEWIKNHSLTLAKGLNETTLKELQTLLSTGFELGESIPQLRRRIDDYYSDKSRAEMVARTETIAASNEGAIQLYESEGVIKVEFYPALDERTCEECMGVYNQSPIWTTAESHGMIPVHPNCRCVFLAVID